MISSPRELEQLRLGDLLYRAAEALPDHPAVIADGATSTWAELRRAVDALGAELCRRGLGKGERVALWMGNSLDWVTAYYALARLGAVIVPINTRLQPTEVAYIIGHAGCEWAIIGGALGGIDQGPALDAVRRETGGLPQRVVSSHPHAKAELNLADLPIDADSAADDLYLERCDDVRATDLAMLLYTSGTTGFPKGVMHTHRVLRNMFDLADRMNYSSDDRLLLYLPLFHVFANFAGLVASAHAGAAVVLMDGFDAAESLRLVEREGVTILMGVPTTYHDQIKVLDEVGADVSSLRFCFAPGAPHDTRAVEEHLATALNMYGMTETTSTTSISRLTDPLDKRCETVGSPLPGSQVRVVDDEGAEVAAGIVGEILVKGHPVMSGYYRDEKATGGAMSADGWFSTGDLGSLTDDLLTFVGRKRDMIKVGGENVDPVEVELVLNSLPGVDLSAAIGVPHDRLDEVVCAYVVPRIGAELDPDDLIASVQTRLASFKRPRHIRVVDQLPLTATGKIQKARLVASFVAESSDD